MKTGYDFKRLYFFAGRFWTSALLLFALLLSMRTLQDTREAQASLLAPGVLRLHIRANSDAAPDQEIKLEVRSLILDFLRARRDEVQSKAAALRLLQNHRAELTAAVNDRLKTRGFTYRAALSFVRCYFPTRSYGSAVYPCGVYDAARITLGSGRGHNWWCVLYPKLCLAEETWETGNEIAAGQEITEKRQEPHASPTVTLKFRLLPGLSIRLPEITPQQHSIRNTAYTSHYIQKSCGASADHSPVPFQSASTSPRAAHR